MTKEEIKQRSKTLFDQIITVSKKEDCPHVWVFVLASLASGVIKDQEDKEASLEEFISLLRRGVRGEFK